LPLPLEDLLKRWSMLLLPFRKWRVPVVRLRGTAKVSGCPTTLIVAGEEPWVNYLPARIFSGVPEREPLGSFPIWNLERRLNALRSGTDLMIIRADRISAKLFFRQAYLIVPAWVDMILRLPKDPATLARGNKNVKQDIRAIRREKFELTESSQGSDFDFFYESLYVPFIVRRFEQFASLRDAHRLRRRFQRGAILWVCRNGDPLTGMLVERRKDTLHVWAIGVLNGDLDIVKEGAEAALYWHVVNFAYRGGYARIQFGGVRPSLNDGLLRYKRKWGATLVEKPDNHYDFLIAWDQWNPSVAGFFSENPLIYRASGFSAIAALVSSQSASEADAKRAKRLLWTDGLNELALISTSGWEPGIVPPVRTSLQTCLSVPGTNELRS
jgi:hypothetical protein